jgi:hypothetical protein
MAGILRASTSLDFPDFRKWVVRHLEENWSEDIRKLSVERLNNASETISLGRQYNIPGVLKRAFYELLRTAGFGQSAMGDSEYEAEDKEDGGDEEQDGERENSTDEEEEGPEGDGVDNEGDGDNGDEQEGDVHESGNDEEVAMSNAGDDTGESTPSEPTVDGEDDCAIPLDDIRRLVNAREHLTTAWILAAASVPTCFPCLDKKACRCMSALLWTKVVHTSGMFEDYLYDPICGFDALINVKWETEGVQRGCIIVRADAWRKQQQKLWDNLDLWLEL